MLTLDLFVNAIVAGILLGGFLAAVSLGISIVFGYLDIVNIAHPAFVVLGSYAVYILNSTFGIDPLLAGIAMAAPFYLLGILIYRFYYAFFERHGAESLRGLVFFFGILFLVEVGLNITYGVDYRMVNAFYLGKSIEIGLVGIPYRLLIPFVAGVAMIFIVYLYLSKTFYGMAIQGVAQDSLAARLMGADPIKIKSVAFGMGMATASVAGALLIMISPIEPSMGREYIGRVFAIAVLGGMGSVVGTLVAAVLLGIAESLTSTFYSPSMAPAVSFGILLLVLAIRPSGIFGR
ncbi:MAG: branched-chain amino acid ABC transporter permease [SAR324 cluster bacterium]|nr:branched-chain amino acid ABC transporter permease [SAR324 cluster bacterium]